MYRRHFHDLHIEDTEAYKAVKSRIEKAISRSGKFYEFDSSSGAMILRNDVLAAAFADGKPSFEYKERPECAAFIPSKGLRKNKKGAAYGSDSK